MPFASRSTPPKAPGTRRRPAPRRKHDPLGHGIRELRLESHDGVAVLVPHRRMLQTRRVRLHLELPMRVVDEVLLGAHL